MNLPIFGHAIVNFGEFGQVHWSLEYGWIGIIRVILVGEDVGEEDDLELVEMKVVGDFEHDGVGVALDEGYLVQYFI